MRKGETKTCTDGQKLKHLDRLVYAMRRAQKLVAENNIVGSTVDKADLIRAVSGYEKSVDYVLEQILGGL